MFKKIANRHNLCLILAAFFFLCITTVPQTSFAANPTDECADGAMNDRFRQSFASVGQAKLQAQNAAMALFGAIDLKVQTCFDKIKGMFTILGSLSDPLALIWSLIAGQILALVNELCSSVLNTLSQLKSFVMSQFNRLCLPLPDFGLGSFDLDLDLKNATCDGVSLFNPGSSTGPLGTPPIFDFRTMFPVK
ncbi:MAG: hypothetical protein WAO98_05970 [Alphaproteobacteria bacterium]